jgi:murein DD-endopeptidase MepM/ murein hydrolase activator NlpD
VPPVLRRFAVGPQPWSPGHRGVDLGARVGQPVLSAGAGVVSFAGPVAGRGVAAVLHAGGLRTTYEPVTSQVRAGDAVAAGDALGSLAPGPHCPGACLHWGALRGDVYVDPLSLLRPPAPPVLLPLAGVAPSVS